MVQIRQLLDLDEAVGLGLPQRVAVVVEENRLVHLQGYLAHKKQQPTWGTSRIRNSNLHGVPRS